MIANPYRDTNMRCSREWYERNREEALKKQRDRARDHPDIAAYRRAAYERYQARIAAGVTPNLYPLYIDVEGDSVRVYRSREVARMIGCSPSSLANWEQQNWLPLAYFNRRRLYTEKQIELIKLFHSVGKKDHDKRTEVSKNIFENW